MCSHGGLGVSLLQVAAPAIANAVAAVDVPEVSPGDSCAVHPLGRHTACRAAGRQCQWQAGLWVNPEPGVLFLEDTRHIIASADP